MCSKGSNQTKTQNAPNPAAMQAYLSVLQRAQGVANNPYQAYGGELVAGINPQQTLGINNINANAGFALPYIQQARGYAEQGAGPISAADIQRYQDPYQKQVVDATQAAFAQGNAKQQQQVVGNAAAQGALGGDRVGVAQANLAGEQATAQNPVIANLYSRGYTQALGAAEADRQAKSNAAYSLGNLGISGQNAALQGAQSQIGAGGLQQQTQQQLDQALYQQFMQQQAFPYMQAGWLGQMAGGLGSQMGGESTTQGPEPNQWMQMMGLGLGAASMFSDRRVKNNVHEIGETKDGQPIYRFRYNGSPDWHIGLIAQEVEKSHPEAVHAVNGVKTVDYKTATDESLANGGRIAGFAGGGTPYGGEGLPYGGYGYIPMLNMPFGNTMPKGEGGSKQQSQQSDPLKLAQGAKAGLSGAGNLWGKANNWMDKQSVDDPDSAYNQGLLADATGGGMDMGGELGPIYHAGGRAGFDEGGEVLPSDLDDPDSPYNKGLAAATTARAQDTSEALATEQPKKSGFGGLFNLGLDDTQRAALMAAGFGMAASRSPHALTAIGEGGLAGLQAYEGLRKEERTTEEKKRATDLQVQKLAQAADQSRQSLDLRRKQLEQADQHHRETFAESQRQHDQTASRPYKIGTDDYGADVYAVTDSHSPNGYRVIKPNGNAPTATAPTAPTDPTQPQPATATSDLHGEEYLNTKPPERREFIRKLANYEINPQTLSTKGGHRERALTEAATFDPTYDSRNYTASATALVQFGPGKKAGDSVRAFNVGIDHLEQLHELGNALQSGNVQKANELKNWVKTQLGYEEPTNFAALKQIVGAEVIKAIVGAGGGVDERKKASDLIAAQSSPAQLAGAIRTLQTAMGAQLGGLKRQYEESTFRRRNDFDRLLSPKAREFLKSHEGGATTGASAAKPQTVVQNGHTYHLQPDDSYK